MKNLNNKANIWTAMATGRKVFRNQMDKTVDIKVRSLRYALESNFPNYYAFGTELSSMVDNLCDSKRFSKECEDLKLEPKIVAQHVIFEGQKTFNQVRDFGVKASFGPRINEFNTPLYAEDYK
ncbi:MAG: hypothetical protein LUD76_06570 [Alistipes sp.]|nr:hypothetical protein [Alistipes sp.]